MKAKRDLRTLLLGLVLVGSLFGSAAAEMKDGSMASIIEGTLARMMDGTLTGMLSGSDGHNASGEVTLRIDTSEGSVLTLSDIRVDRVPDGRVYLAKDGDYRQGVELGLLKQFSGTVSFPVPAGTDPGEFNSVVIWCEKFSVEIGRAFLTKK